MNVNNLPGGPEFHAKVLKDYKTRLWKSRRYKTREQSDRQAVLMFAIWHCTTADVEAALEAGADPNNSFRARTPLGDAIRQSRRDVIDLLIRKGADPNKPSYGHSPLYLTHYFHKPHLRKTLLSAGAKLPPKDEKQLGTAARAWTKAMRDAETPMNAGAGSGAVSKELDAGVIVRLRGLTRSRLVRLQTEAGEIAGGWGCPMEEERARKFVQDHQADFLKSKAFLIFSRDLLKRPGAVVAVLPANDAGEVVAAVGTNGANDDVTNADIVAWLRQLDTIEEVQIYGIGLDFVEGRFTKPVADPLKLARRIAAICPENMESPASVRREAKRIEHTQRFLLWWD